MAEFSEIGLHLSALRRRLPIILLIFLVGSVIAFAIAALWPPIYRSEAKLIMESQRIPTDLVRPTVLDPGDQRLQLVQQRVMSRDVVLGLVEKFNLMPNEKAKLTPSDIVERMLSKIVIERSDPSTIARRGRNESLVTLFVVGFEDRSPNIAARVANELVTLVLNEDVRTRTSQAADTTRFLESETEKRRKELLEIETIISAFKRQHDESLPEKLPFQMTQLEQARTKLTSFDREIQVLDEQKRLLELEFNIRAAAGPDGVKSPDGREALRQKVEALNAELAVKSTIYTQTHPDIITIKKLIAAIKDQESQLPVPTQPAAPVGEGDESNLSLDERLLREKIATVADRKRFVMSRREETARDVEKLTTLISGIPAVQAQLENLQSRREVVAKGLAELADKLNAARLGERLERDQQAERLQVIEQPIVPAQPIRPNRPAVLLAGVGVAAGLALAFAFLLETLNRTVRYPSDIDSALGQLPLATIPYIGTRGERKRSLVKKVLVVLIGVLLLVSIIIVIHVFYMPLDLVLFRLFRRFSVSM